MFQTRQTLLLALVVPFALGACDMAKITVNTTAKVLKRAQPSAKQEADFDLAARAMPGTLKTIEGFHYVNPGNDKLPAILAEGFCQYGSGFVEDEWELAINAKDYDLADHQARRATKMFVRCTNYALKMLGSSWQKNIFGEFATINKMIANAGSGSRDGMMWAAVGIASTINMNKDKMSAVAQLPTAKAMLQRVVAIDDASPPSDKSKQALPHMALAMMAASQAPSMGGEPEVAKQHFERALEITQNKYLIAKVYMARRYAVQIQDRELFRKLLVEVLQTAPSIWPDQRLANEIAHRRARRYLSMEKELF